MAAHSGTQSTLFLSGLPEDVTEEALQQHLEAMDKTLRPKLINVIRDNQTFRPKGFATIEMATHEEGIHAHDP